MPPKRKKRFHGLYYHSSPPRVLPMNGQSPSETKKKSADEFSVRLSTIRIWMHEKDIGKLTRVLWAGQGNRLQQQASTNPRVKRFLSAVPYVMNTIKDVHQAVVDNNLETLQATMEPPVPPALITCRDANGLNVVHKAAGLGHTMILEYLLGIWPEGAHEMDMTGKTPLHWAACAKNNMRCYALLTQSGCEEDALDYKMKTPAYYKQKHNEIERSFLTLVPEAPRVSHDVPTDWEGLAGDENDNKKKPGIKHLNGRRKSDTIGNGLNLLTSRSEANSIENTSEPDLFEGGVGIEEPPEPSPEEEPESKNDNENTLESYPLTNGNENISGPPSQPKTPETPPMEGEIEIEVDPEPEQENVTNALNDQKNEEANGTNEDEDKANDDEIESGDQNVIDENEIQADDSVENENAEDTIESETKEENLENNVEVEVSNEEEREEEAEEEEEEKNNENKELNEDDNEKEKTDEAESMHNNDENEQEDNEVTNEDEIANGNNLHDNLNEDENIKEEESKVAEEEADNKPEVPPVEESQLELENHQSEHTSSSEEQNGDENNNEESVSNKDESEGQVNENDDDDDDQDIQLDNVDTGQKSLKEDSESIPEFDDKMTTDSPTSSLAIEGYVLGDSEDNQVQSESAAYLDDEENYIKAIIDSGDMEQLAALVLNGEGKKLLNRESTQPEIQAFLNNVPAYMNKISRVHETARKGSLYQLQSALDRRKFAIAKDEMSPCGASPLHVAVLFGHSDIVRYLAGRFPETTSVVDDDGRTALHYAATIKDNGHFFSLLSHLGGNPKATDKLGNTAEFYTNEEEAKNVLTYKQLLLRFGAETLEEEMLRDQGEAETNSQNAIFKTEQGRYLASSLGDPLIQGLTEIAEKRPSDPVAYLAGFLQNFLRSRKNSKNNRDDDSSDTNSTVLVNSESDINVSPKKLNRMDSALVEERYSSPESTPKNDDRDEHGQSMLHFACARSHRRNGLLNLIQESQIDVTYRDELYRTARDVSLQANQPGNAKEIDRYILSLAVVGDTKPFENMAIAGYDHILDVVDDEGISITDVAESRGHDRLVEFLSDLRNLEETREELHQSVRDGDFEKVKEITSTPKGKWLIKAKNYYGRTAMHIAILKELEEMVEYFVNTCPDVLRSGDNLERTPLHYAMGTNSVEVVSRVLIRKGAKRTIKDLKGRQPSYYFINKADILRLQEEEEEHR